MKKILFLILLFQIFQLQAKVTYGPISTKSHCPGGSRGVSSGKVKYCIFEDPKVIQVVNSRCPPGVRHGSSTSIGKENWCVIRK